MDRERNPDQQKHTLQRTRLDPEKMITNDPISSQDSVPSENMRPFHERWPQILRYPLQLGALSTIVAIAVAHLIAYLPVLGFILDLLVWAAFFKYAFEVLRWSANGREQAPEISLTVSDAVSRYAMLLLVFAELLIILLALLYGIVPALVLGVVLMFAIPAIMMILALDEGMARALNPLAWLMLANRIGRPYLVLVGFFCAAILVQSVFAHGIATLLPGVVATALAFFVVNYLMIINFHLIGCVIHQHADELGYAGHVELQYEVPWTDPARKFLEWARERAATGDTRGAATLLREELAAHPEMLTLHDEYRHWLRRDEEKAELVAHGKIFVPALLAQNQDRRAIDIVRECQMLDPAFALENAEDITRLAHAAADAGQTQIALGLVAGFHKRFRNHPDIAGNYLLAAKLWAERMNKEMQARAMLQQIKLTLPNDLVIPQVDAYIAFLDKLAATPAKPVSNAPKS
jgi:hypothetical protein